MDRDVESAGGESRREGEAQRDVQGAREVTDQTQSVVRCPEGREP